jgi:hypothetical protein
MLPSSTTGIYRIVAADQTAVSGAYRTDEERDSGEMVGNGLQNCGGSALN